MLRLDSGKNICFELFLLLKIIAKDSGPTLPINIKAIRIYFEYVEKQLELIIWKDVVEKAETTEKTILDKAISELKELNVKIRFG